MRARDLDPVAAEEFDEDMSGDPSGQRSPHHWVYQEDGYGEGLAYCDKCGMQEY